MKEVGHVNMWGDRLVGNNNKQRLDTTPTPVLIGEETYLTKDGEVFHDGEKMAINKGFVQTTKQKRKSAYNIRRLVAKHFVSNPFNLPHIRPLDGNQYNCSADNLTWSICRSVKELEALALRVEREPYRYRELLGKDIKEQITITLKSRV